MKEIILTQGLTTIVDDDLYDWLMSLGKWCAIKSRHTTYAKCSTYSDGEFRLLAMHRIILDAKPGQITDHINQNGLDNRKGNLRIVSHAENIRNSQWSKGSSGYYGVWKFRFQYRAAIYINRLKSTHLGLFNTPEEAARAYDRKSIEIGRIDKLNFPEEYHVC